MIASAAAAVPPSPPLQSAAVPAVTEDSLETARLLADAGRVRDAEVMVRSIIARRGPSAPAIELLAMIRMSVNDAPGAKRLFEQAVYLEPARAASLLQLAILSEAAGETARAAAYWDRARRASVNPGQEQRS
jgi:Tfp pilus assembly protein PilF